MWGRLKKVYGVSRKPLILLARPRGIEPLTKNLEGSCSIQLSYGRTGTGAKPSRVAHNIVIAPHAVKLCGAWAEASPQNAHGVTAARQFVRQSQGPPQATARYVAASPQRLITAALSQHLTTNAPHLDVTHRPHSSSPNTTPCHGSRAAHYRKSSLRSPLAHHFASCLARRVTVLPLTCGQLCAKLIG